MDYIHDAITNVRLNIGPNQCGFKLWTLGQGPNHLPSSMFFCLKILEEKSRYRVKSCVLIYFSPDCLIPTKLRNMHIEISFWLVQYFFEGNSNLNPLCYLSHCQPALAASEANVHLKGDLSKKYYRKRRRPLLLPPYIWWKQEKKYNICTEDVLFLTKKYVITYIAFKNGL